jgi:hypothetical protein
MRQGGGGHVDGLIYGTPVETEDYLTDGILTACGTIHVSQGMFVSMSQNMASHSSACNGINGSHLLQFSRINWKQRHSKFYTRCTTTRNVTQRNKTKKKKKKKVSDLECQPSPVAYFPSSSVEADFGLKDTFPSTWSQSEILPSPPPPTPLQNTLTIGLFFLFRKNFLLKLWKHH